MSRRAARTGLAVLAVIALVVACAPQSTKVTATPTRPEPVVSEPVAPAETAVLPGGSAQQLAADAALAFFESAPLAVVAAPGTDLRAASIAVALGVPLLRGDAAERTASALTELGTETVLTVGDPDVPADLDVVAAPEDDAALGELIRTDFSPEPVPAGEEVTTVAGLDPDEPKLLGPADSESGETPTDEKGEDPGSSQDSNEDSGEDSTATLPYTQRPDPAAASAVVMSTGEPAQAGAVANARAAGAVVQVVPSGDPRVSSETVQETAANAPEVTVGLGKSFGDAETLAWRTATAATGTELPGGGQLVLPGKTYVAMYGTPGTDALGVLGEQGVGDTVRRAADLARPYRSLTDTEVVPALEIIASVATAGAGPDGNYSNEQSVEVLRPLVEAAAEHGQYVVLDLQPGRADFLTQAKHYEELLRMPHVGLALDPEWRLRPDEEPLQRIGHVDVAEVNSVVNWLADLTRKHSLPQKLLVLHQFQPRMIPGVNDVDQSRSELAVLIHADGQGGQGAKQGTWSRLRNNAPDVQWWGWKNFYDEDQPMLTPEQTMAVEPTPNFISYQ
ncbi:hypothetical protein GCM10023169_38250 [Georgenia halophila]|uniref:Lipoprotein n=1 Tax=Georgenia halophila TaxID=620889 RepID=A0ABP8LMC9_9MICO